MIPFIPPEFHFLRPWWFAALLPMLIFLPLLWKKKLRGQQIQNFCDPALLPHLMLDQGVAAQKRSLPLILLTLAWLTTIIALAGPAWQRLEQPVFTVSKARVLVLDLSPSMMTADVQPNRLSRAIFKLKDILQRCKEGRTGLVVFGGEAHVVVPLTDDIATIETLLPALQVDIIPEPGDRAEDALDAAAALLRRGGAKSGDIILLTDGVADVAAALSTLDNLRDNHLRLSVLAVGTEKGGPTLRADGAFAQGSDGAVRISRLNVANLKELAASGGGVFNMMTADDDDLDHILTAGPAAEIEEQESRLDREMEKWRDEGIWLLPLVLLLASFGLRKGWILGLSFIMLSSAPLPARAFEWADMWQSRDQRAARLLEQGDAAGAADLFDDPAWRGAAQYQAGDYQKATQTFQDQARNPYNLGNSLAREGKLDKALAAYEQALKNNPKDEDAIHNRDLLKKLLEEQKQQQQQQNQQGDSGEDQKDSDQQKNQQQDQQQGDQNKDSDQQDDSQQGKDQPPEEQGKSDEQQSQSPDNQQQQQDGREQDQSDGQQDQAGQQKDDQQSDQAEEPQAQEADRDQQDEQDERDEREQNAATSKPDQQQQTQAEKGQEMRAGVEDDQGEPLSEEEMAVEQWLRQVPDDPSKLLRRKFMMEHMRNKRER